MQCPDQHLEAVHPGPQTGDLIVKHGDDEDEKEHRQDEKGRLVSSDPHFASSLAPPLLLDHSEPVVDLLEAPLDLFHVFDQPGRGWVV